MQAQRTFEFWRGILERHLLNRVRNAALADAAARGTFKATPQLFRGAWQWPGSVSIEAGRDARAQIELFHAGLATAADIYGEGGLDWESAFRQRGKEAAFIRQIAKENGVTPAEISGGPASVATDPMLAPAPGGPQPAPAPAPAPAFNA